MRRRFEAWETDGVKINRLACGTLVLDHYSNIDVTVPDGSLALVRWYEADERHASAHDPSILVLGRVFVMGRWVAVEEGDEKYLVSDKHCWPRS